MLTRRRSIFVFADFGVVVACVCVDVLVFFFGILISTKIIDAPWFERLGGKGDRVVFQRMLAYAIRRKLELLLFMTLDRLSREGAFKTSQYLDPRILRAVVSIVATLAKQERVR